MLSLGDGMPNQQLVKMQFGSHVYGTNLPSSDRDYKGVFIPDAQDLVMQRASKHIRNSTKKDDSTRNTAEDVDDESFSFQTYMELIRQGQTVALDMLFTPEHFYCKEVPVDYRWREIVENRKDLIHKGTNAFVGYTKAQAAKYGHKGDRLMALNLFMNAMKDWDGHRLLGDYAGDLATLVQSAASKEAEIAYIPSPEYSMRRKMCHIFR
jgi:predicted nucleotidyltransferase